MSTLTENKFFDKPTPGTEAGLWGGNLNNLTFDYMDKALSGVIQINVSSANYYLNQSESQNSILHIKGNLTANVNLILPLNYSSTAAVKGTWVIWNDTTGAFNVGIVTIVSGSQGVYAPQSANTIVFSDGTNVYFSDSRVAQAATGGGSDQVFFLNDQQVTSSYTIPTSKNAMTAGPVSISSGATVTINPPTVWTIV